jgi:hypothetical protein
MALGAQFLFVTPIIWSLVVIPLVSLFIDIAAIELLSWMRELVSEP